MKRRSTGLIDDELTKLDALTTALAAPWSVVAACEYAVRAGNELLPLILRHEADGTYKRIVLTYDRILEPMLVWSMGRDPFALTALTEDEIVERERSFVDGLVRRSDDESNSMFEYEMLNKHRPATKTDPRAPFVVNQRADGKKRG